MTINHSFMLTQMSGTATTATTGVVNFEEYTSGGFAITSTAAFTGSPLVAFKVANSPDSTSWWNLYGSTGALVQVAAAVNKKAYPLPSELVGWPAFKMWLETSGTGIAQASIKTFVVVLKG